MKRWLKRIRSIKVVLVVVSDGEHAFGGWSWSDMHGEDDRYYATKIGAWLSAVIS